MSCLKFLVSTLSIANGIVPHSIYSPQDTAIKELKEKVDKLEVKVDNMEKCLKSIKHDNNELKKISYGLIGVVGGSGALVGGTNLIKNKKKK